MDFSVVVERPMLARRARGSFGCIFNTKHQEPTPVIRIAAKRWHARMRIDWRRDCSLPRPRSDWRWNSQPNEKRSFDVECRGILWRAWGGKTFWEECPRSASGSKVSSQRIRPTHRHDGREEPPEGCSLIQSKLQPEPGGEDHRVSVAERWGQQLRTISSSVLSGLS